MPSLRPTLSRAEADHLVVEAGFGPYRGARTPEPVGASGTDVGIELEWVTVDLRDPTRPVPFDLVRRAAHSVEPLPGGARVSFEPGGQVELSSPPRPLGVVCSALAADADRLGAGLARAGVGLVGIGLEPGPCRERAVHSPRYDAMETYFDADGPAGRTMMRSTAAIQVNLDLGTGPEIERRWRAAHDLGPLLAASFANSPLGPDGPTGSRSTRLAVWAAIDRGRTAPAGGNGRGPRPAWSHYALSARVMLVRTDESHHEPLVAPLTFAEWIEHGHELGWPTDDDLAYHLTTLFPPVRPRGWLELRMIDSLPTPWWRVAAAVAAVLVQDQTLADVVGEAGAATRGLAGAALSSGLADPTLHAAARSCFAAALRALPRAGADRETLAATEAYLEQYVERGRCPADDRLDAWHHHGSRLPVPDNCVSGDRSGRPPR